MIRGLGSPANGLPLALTGAAAATRYVGATASGAPASGRFLVGDFVIDQTGSIYICTVAGSPGTWTQVGGSAGVNVQAVTTNSVVTGGYWQYGWSFITGDGSSGAIAKTITFPTAFVNTIALVQGGQLGGRDGSDPAALADFNFTTAGNVWPSFSAYSITKSGFVAKMGQPSPALSNAFRYGFWWSAFGT